MGVQVRAHRPGEELDAFLDVPAVVYREDRSFVAPLRLEVRERLTPKKNPFFQHGEAQLFTAWRNGRLVGRISAQLDHEHLKRYGDATGFFGFFDTVDDAEVARALVGAAEAWVGERGMTRLRGPLSLSMNEEVGLLVDGFDSPPVLMMAHHRPYQGALAESTGLAKAKDFFAWKYVVADLPSRAERAWQQLQGMPEVRLRSVKKSRMHEELVGIMEVFNDAWSQNWGFVPATEAEVRKTAEDLKLILDEDLAFVAEIDGRVVAICICLPNLNEALEGLGGRLLPLGFAKLLWRVKVKHPKSARLMLLGIRGELRHVKRYGILSTAMYAELSKRGAKKGYEWAELSWTLEDNRPVNLGIQAMGGKVYKRYRVYEKAVSG